MQNYEARMLRVLTYIHDHPAEDLSLDRLAEVAAMSRFHWHRVFRAMTGETCAQAVRRVRLHRAASLLLREDVPVAEVAQRVGYDQLRSFNRAFAAQYGQTPQAFRSQPNCTPSDAVHALYLAPETKTGEKFMYDITVRSAPEQIVIGLPHQGSYHEIGAAFERFFTLCQSRNLWPRLGLPIGLYFDNPAEVAEAELRSMAGAELLGGEVPIEMQRKVLPAGRMAVLTYQGPYAGLSGAYDVLYGQWLPQSGELPADAPCFERYLNNPREVAEADLLTEICLPLLTRVEAADVATPVDAAS
ncbi:AraC family transcriptional regulator [Shimia marina]|uniref:Right origin-binding protein n=1 Tax=Shimia marina TaxID=321267 RepID=A0A0N7LSK6_9RHOB|nr:AraC family transcriptional regulator [Shimia marina]CUH53884.1 Right origin-binding protein [Shimia marina]SFE20351.1 transcriptional regulator, AraC family [Shimia marina]